MGARAVFDRAAGGPVEVRAVPGLEVEVPEPETRESPVGRVLVRVDEFEFVPPD